MFDLEDGSSDGIADQEDDHDEVDNWEDFPL